MYLWDLILKIVWLLFHVFNILYTRCWFQGVLLILATGKVAYGVDPSACPRFLKFMLINACGVTKREFQQLPFYQVMSDDEIDMQYYEMVQANTIKGVHSNSIEGGAYNFHNSDDHDISREW